MDLHNHFLLPMPTIAGDYFADTLTLVCQHDDQGAMGLVLNKPTPVSLYELISDVGGTPEQSLLQSPVYDGGPVDPQRGFILLSEPHPEQICTELMPGLYLSTAMEVLTTLTSDSCSRGCLVALGYAGWGAGQLEQEISNNVWLTMPAQPELIFGCAPEQRLPQAAEELGINLSLVANPGHA